MKVIYIFSRNNKIGSKLIVWFSKLLLQDLDKIPSHVALLLECENFKIVVESVLTGGVRILPYKAWLDINEECYKIPALTAPEDIHRAISSTWGKKYDWMGVFYFIVAFLRKKILGKPFPDKNRWSNPNRYFCTEIAAKLSGYTKHEMVTPAKMCLDLLNGEVNKKK